MKTLIEIQDALRERYAGVLKQINDRSYIPWDQAARVALEIFGVDGCDIEVKGYQLEKIPNEQGQITYGYSAVVRLSVFTSDGRTFVREGLGFNELQFTQKGVAQIDPAIKGAASGGLLRALVLLGDAFGLFLYSEKSGSPRQQNSSKSTDVQTNNRPAISDGQQRALRAKGFTAGHINQIASMSDWRQRKALMDDVLGNGMSVSEACQQYGIEDGDGEEWPF